MLARSVPAKPQIQIQMLIHKTPAVIADPIILFSRKQ